MPFGNVVVVDGAMITGVFGGDSASTESAEVGALARIETPSSTAYGLVSSLRIDDPSWPPSGEDKRFVELELFGECLHNPASGEHGEFQRGVSSYPQLGAEIFPADTEDLNRVYADKGTSTVRIGTLHQDRSIAASISTDDLLGKHFAVVGNSGSGKSCSVALVLHSILAKHPNGHVVLLDPHNEYRAAFGELAEVVDPNTLELPYWLLDFEETCEVLIGRDSGQRETEVGILKSAILEAKRKYFGERGAEFTVTVDTPIPYRLASVLQFLESAMGRLDRAEGAIPYLRIKTRIEQLTADTRFQFMFSGMFVTDTMRQVITRLLRVPVDGRPVTIVDLSGVPSEIVDVVVSMLARMIFDFALWADRADSMPVLVVCEEAHRYVPHDDKQDFGSTKKSLARIAKEGRKYGVSLCLITQRPSELSASVLSQCSTLIAMRMSSHEDQAYVSRALPDTAEGFMSALPSLRTQEALLVGEGVSVPVRLRFDDLPEHLRPRSGTKSFSQLWQEDTTTTDFVDDVIRRWRSQTR